MTAKLGKFLLIVPALLASCDRYPTTLANVGTTEREVVIHLNVDPFIVRYPLKPGEVIHLAERPNELVTVELIDGNRKVAELRDIRLGFWSQPNVVINGGSIRLQ